MLLQYSEVTVISGWIDMPTREKTLWARIFESLANLFRGKPKPNEPSLVLAIEHYPQFVQINPEIELTTSHVESTKQAEKKEINPEFKLSARLSKVAASNTPKALRKQRRPLRSTAVRPAPIKTIQAKRKKRDIGPVTWAAYKGRNSAPSVKIALSTKRSAQVLRLHTKPHMNNQPMTSKSRSSVPKTISSGFARAA